MSVQKVSAYAFGASRFRRRSSAEAASRRAIAVKRAVAMSAAAAAALSLALHAPGSRLSETEAVAVVRAYVAARVRGERRDPLTYESMLGDPSYGGSSGSERRRELAARVTRLAARLAGSLRRAAAAQGIDPAETSNLLAIAAVTR